VILILFECIEKQLYVTSTWAKLGLQLVLHECFRNMCDVSGVEACFPFTECLPETRSASELHSGCFKLLYNCPVFTAANQLPD
jgi:hypothetical protein